MGDTMPLQVTICPNCNGGAKAIHGYNNDGSPRLGGPCGRCHAAGFVPIIDGEPSHPFGKDSGHPALVAHERLYPTRKTVSGDTKHEQGELM
jgi:hypothetical protein